MVGLGREMNSPAISMKSGLVKYYSIWPDYIPPTSPHLKGTATLDHFTTSRDSGLGGVTMCDCFWVVWSHLEMGPELD